jgi:hypothetical protein
MFSSAGAYAQIFDISCLVGKPEFSRIADDAMTVWGKLPASASAAKIGALLTRVRSPSLLGQHYFITNPVNATAGISPKWDFTSGAFKGKSNAFIVAAKNAGMPALTGKQDVDWLYLQKLAGTTGELATEVYRTDTRLGQPPASVSIPFPSF